VPSLPTFLQSQWLMCTPLVTYLTTTMAPFSFHLRISHVTPSLLPVSKNYKVKFTDISTFTVFNVPHWSHNGTFNFHLRISPVALSLLPISKNYEVKFANRPSWSEVYTKTPLNMNSGFLFRTCDRWTDITIAISFLFLDVLLYIVHTNNHFL
jgi:hypothetical protein